MRNLDQFFALNLIVDAFLLGCWLWLTSTRLGWRWAGGAMLGAVYATLAQMPGLAVLRGPLGLLAVPALMVALARRLRKPAPIARETLGLLTLAAGLGGITYTLAGLARVSASGVAGLAALGAAMVLMALGVGRLRRWLSRGEGRRRLCDVEIRIAGRSTRLRALLDTGFLACDPLTGRPLVVVELRALRAVLPPAMVEALGRPALEAAGEVAAASAASGLLARLVSLKTIARREEWLFGVRGQIVTQGGPCTEVLVGVTPASIAPNGSFDAIAAPAVLAGAVGEVAS